MKNFEGYRALWWQNVTNNTGNVEFPIHQTCMFLEVGRNPSTKRNPTQTQHAGRPQLAPVGSESSPYILHETSSQKDNRTQTNMGTK